MFVLVRFYLLMLLEGRVFGLLVGEGRLTLRSETWRISCFSTFLCLGRVCVCVESALLSSVQDEFSVLAIAYHNVAVEHDYLRQPAEAG